MSGGEAGSWRAVREEVLRRINERIWPPGALIPGEAELAEEFGCARATVNRALRDLAEAGLVTRRRKAGTRVSVAPMRRATLKIPVTRLEIEGRGSVYRHALLEAVRTGPPALLRSRLDLPENAAMLHMRAMHLADDRPFLYEDRWVNLAMVPGILEADLARTSANEWLVRNSPFTRGEIAFHAANATPLEAELLGTQPGTAIFVAERTTWNHAQPITTVRMAYAPGYRMVTTI